MTAVDSMKLSATQLGDLPGNKITGAQKVGQHPAKYKQGVKMYMRPAPSEHFINATSNQSSSQTSSPVDENGEDSVNVKASAVVSSNDKTEDVAVMRKNSIFSVKSEPITLASHKNSSPSGAEVESNSSKASVSTTTSGVYCEYNDSGSEKQAMMTQMHAYSEAKERRLLDSLIQFDEDEENRINRIQTDEEIYQMWRNGETRRGSKTGSEFNSNRRNRGAKPATSNTKTQILGVFSKRGNKPDVICGWETMETRKPALRIKEERKPKVFNISSRFGGIDRNNESNESNGFMFFHYTDIARYIQQYRSNHVCENPHANYPCCQEASCITGVDMREMNYPIKFDLTSTGAYRHRVSPTKPASQKPAGNETNDSQPAASGQKSTKKTSSPAPGYLSPVAFRPPYVSRPNEESLNNTVRKMWNSYENKSPEKSKETLPETTESSEIATQIKKQNLLEELPNKFRHPTPGTKWLGKSSHKNFASKQPSPEARMAQEVREIRDKNASNKVSSKTQSEPPVEKDVLSDAKIEEIPYQTVDKCFTIPKLHQFRLQDNSKPKQREKLSAQDAKARRAQNAVLQEDYFLDSYENRDGDRRYIFCNMDESSLTELSKSRSKNLRMKTLIAAEIYNIQQQRVISIDQKHKLDKFRQALSNMTYHNAKPATALPPTDSATRNIIAGSVRAFYARTAKQERYAAECAEAGGERRCWQEEQTTDTQDDKPIILVSQPHLRHLSAAPKKPESPLLKKKIIGGRPNEKSSQHPADAKQFTRITDLLRIKKRQQSSRRVTSGLSRITPVNSARQRRNSSSSQISKPQKRSTIDDFSEKSNMKT